MGASVVCMCVSVCVVVILMMVCGVGDSMGEIVGDWGLMVFVLVGAGCVLKKSVGILGQGV